MAHDPELLPQYLLRPGFLFIPDEAMQISAVLGSCVAVALFDRRHRRGGMNHFLYPSAPGPEQSTTLYGNVATRVLIRSFLDTPSSQKHLEAMIFGGAAPESMVETLGIAEKNIHIARFLLQKAGIPISVEDVGGTRGRKVVFDTASGESIVYRAERLRQGDWYPYAGMR
ncbi:chemotaxis protein CheD [Desulfobotulus sp.]|jgi:chemotaxis protein CheD|uniref:chemotaxis protein CheD n=1 Tax=Desulfobotulus sp. TaxID=1940337 RepID=UPI002A36E7FA|nr:chemotaxis protein CheD [Desulfobotulus sp.]MDY0163725.1 chemotaxis protein CheD [Desulfobotulus sp.]